MSAEPNPSPSNQKKDLIQKFRQEYGAALADARLSAEHTATDGWQRLYQQHVEHERQTRRSLAKQLRDMSDRLEDFGLGEDDEKSVKEVAKSSAELRDSTAVFIRDVLDRVCAPVKSCQRIAEEYRARAARDESSQPLLNVGLEELMRSEIEKQPKAEWDDEAGTITVTDPKKGD